MTAVDDRQRRAAYDAYVAADRRRQERNRAQVEHENRFKRRPDPLPDIIAPLNFDGPWAIGEERRLIFENVANGVRMEKIKAAFSRSEEQVWRDVEFVGRKIREARFRTRKPPLEVDGLQAIRWNRRALLETLEELRSDYLATDLIIPRIGIQQLDDPKVIKEAAQHVHARVTGL